MAWLSENIMSLVLLAAVVLIAFFIVRRRSPCRITSGKWSRLGNAARRRPPKHRTNKISGRESGLLNTL